MRVLIMVAPFRFPVVWEIVVSVVPSGLLQLIAGQPFAAVERHTLLLLVTDPTSFHSATGKLPTAQ